MCSQNLHLHVVHFYMEWLSRIFGYLKISFACKFYFPCFSRESRWKLQGGRGIQPNLASIWKMKLVLTSTRSKYCIKYRCAGTLLFRCAEDQLTVIFTDIKARVVFY